MRAIAPVIAGLALLVGCTDESSPRDRRDTGVATVAEVTQDRFIVTQSAYDHGGTLGALLEALDRRDLTVFAVIDHRAGAATAGQSLAPTTLVLFGNPRAGTPLIQSAPLMAAELPLKALVYNQGDNTYLAVTGLSYLERTYPLAARTDLIDSLRDMLDALTDEATGTG